MTCDTRNQRIDGIIPETHTDKNMKKSKHIALVAHDNRKKDLVEWVEFNYKTLLGHHLICTGTTGILVEETISR